jgi:hypothetical protein
VGSQVRGHTTQTGKRSLLECRLSRLRSTPTLRRASSESSPGRFQKLNLPTARRHPRPEYLRLRQHYDEALRRWAQIELSSYRPGLIDASARLAELVRQKALDEKNAAIQRMRFHEQNCPTSTRGANLVANSTSVSTGGSDGGQMRTLKATCLDRWASKVRHDQE